MSKEAFIKDLVDVLNKESKYKVEDGEHPLDVCFMISVVDQKIGGAAEFIDDICKYKYTIDYSKDNYYGNGKVNIYIKTNDDHNYFPYDYFPYHYELQFSYDERMWGYCCCKPGDEKYNEEHRCCGNGCDWSAPSFSLSKVIGFGLLGYDGIERDYWEYEDKFNADARNTSAVVEIHKKEQKAQQLKDQIKALTQELNNLDID